jgi:predicted nucleic-acid-binding protein
MTIIGLDTNVVLRLLTNDDAKQRRAALRLAEGMGRDYTAFLSLISVVELNWALWSKLGFSKQDAARAVGSLLQTRGLVIEHHNLVVKALRLVLAENADFADALIAARSLQEGCSSIKTFDRKAARKIPGMELLA